MKINPLCSGREKPNDCSFCRTHPVHNEDLPDTEPLLQELGRYGNRVEVTEPPAGGRRQKQVLLNSEEGEAEAAVEAEEELTSAHSPQRDVQAAGRQRNRSDRRKRRCSLAARLRQLLYVQYHGPHTHTHTVACGQLRAALLMWGPLGFTDYVGTPDRCPS